LYDLIDDAMIPFAA